MAALALEFKSKKKNDDDELIDNEDVDADFMTCQSDYMTPKEADDLLSSAQVLREKGEYKESLKKFIQYRNWLISQAEGEDLTTEHTLTTANMFMEIGNAMLDQGIYDQALTNFEQALEIYKKKLGDDHPNVAASYNNIGLVYRNQGNTMMC